MLDVKCLRREGAIDKKWVNAVPKLMGTHLIDDVLREPITLLGRGTFNITGHTLSSVNIDVDGNSTTFSVKLDDAFIGNRSLKLVRFYLPSGDFIDPLEASRLVITGNSSRQGRRRTIEIFPDSSNPRILAGNTQSIKDFVLSHQDLSRMGTEIRLRLVAPGKPIQCAIGHIAVTLGDVPRNILIGYAEKRSKKGFEKHIADNIAADDGIGKPFVNRCALSGRPLKIPCIWMRCKGKHLGVFTLQGVIDFMSHNTANEIGSGAICPLCGESNKFDDLRFMSGDSIEAFGISLTAKRERFRVSIAENGRIFVK